MRLKNILFLYCMLIASGTNAQGVHGKGKDSTENEQVYSVFDERPAPPYDLNKYFAENIHYPDSARNNDIEGKVVVKFVVKKNGTISKCAISRGIAWDLDAEALRVVCSMPPWKPGKIKGRPVKVWFEQPVRFKLE